MFGLRWPKDPLRPRFQRHVLFFFWVDDEGSFRTTFVEPINFHGQLRLRTVSGVCEVERSKVFQTEKPKGSAPEVLQGPSSQGEEQLRRGSPSNALPHFLRACSAGEKAGCIKAATIANGMGLTMKAAARTGRTGFPPQSDRSCLLLICVTCDAGWLGDLLPRGPCRTGCQDRQLVQGPTGNKTMQRLRSAQRLQRLEWGRFGVSRHAAYRVLVLLLPKKGQDGGCRHITVDRLYDCSDSRDVGLAIDVPLSRRSHIVSCRQDVATGARMSTHGPRFE